MRLQIVVIHACLCQIATRSIYAVRDRFLSLMYIEPENLLKLNYDEEYHLSLICVTRIIYFIYFSNTMIKMREKVIRVISKLEIYILNKIQLLDILKKTFFQCIFKLQNRLVNFDMCVNSRKKTFISTNIYFFLFYFDRE